MEGSGNDVEQSTWKGAAVAISIVTAESTSQDAVKSTPRDAVENTSKTGAESTTEKAPEGAQTGAVLSRALGTVESTAGAKTEHHGYTSAGITMPATGSG